MRRVVLLIALGGAACAHRPPPASPSKPPNATPGAPGARAPAWGEAPHDQRTEENTKIDAASHGP